MNTSDRSILERSKNIQKCLLFLGLIVISRTGVLFTAQAQTQINTVASALFRQLDLGQVFELTFPTELTDSLRFDLGKEMTLQNLTVFRDELVWGGRFAQYFYPKPTVYRRNLEKSITFLITEMAVAGMHSVRLSDIQSLAIARIQEKRSTGEIGECYKIESNEEPFLQMALWICLSDRIQAEIDVQFKIQIDEMNLSERERESLNFGRFTLSEISELRALRAASQIFEQNTYLKDDAEGSNWTNIKGELFGGFQFNCWNRTITYNSFIEVLSQRGLLQHFFLDRMVTKRPPIHKDWLNGGHVASRIVSLRTREEFVVDSWYESGGSATHILGFDDWLELPVSYLRKPLFKDVAEIGFVQSKAARDSGCRVLSISTPDTSTLPQEIAF